MKIPDFKFKEEGVTLDWQEEGSLVGYIRIHSNKDVIPGPVLYSCAIEVHKDNTFEFKILKKHTEDEVVHLRAKLRPIIEHLLSLGYTCAWSRFSTDNVKKVEILDNNIPKISNEDYEG